MNYLINGVLKYNSDDGTLYLIDGSADMLTLSRIANELLYIMVGNSGNPLSREHILNELWTKKGLSSSGNNLNNYMSMLRKVLSNLGFSEVIITIPKHGFMFNADVEIILDDMHEGSYFWRRNVTFASSVDESDSFYEKIKNVIACIRNTNISLLAVILIILFVFSLSFVQGLNMDNYSFKINNCNVYLLEDSGVKRKTADDFSVVKNYVAK